VGAVLLVMRKIERGSGVSSIRQRETFGSVISVNPSSHTAPSPAGRGDWAATVRHIVEPGRRRIWFRIRQAH